jgi:hypothetical protein
MPLFLVPELQFELDIQKGVRIIKDLPIPRRLKKRLLAEWFQEGERVKFAQTAKREAYQRLLGEFQARRMIG